MKILHINQSDMLGGAAIAGYRLHQGLLAQGVDSCLLVGKVNTSDEKVAEIPRASRIQNQLVHITSYLGLNYIHHINSFDISQHSFYQDADLLNLHNLHSTRFSYLAIPKLTQNKPAIWTLHDMWSFTGHCTYSFDCNRWQTGCGNCPYPNTYPRIRRDNTALEWQLKNWLYSHSNLTIVTPSYWLTKQVKQSMLNRFAIHHIPHGIDTEIYQPLDQQLCRTVLGISQHKNVLMFGAQTLKDSRKGGDLLLKALALLSPSLKAATLLLIIGSDGEEITKTIGIPYMSLGYIESARLQSVAYSAADLFLFPTRADNFPLVLQESMACGTPMVSFKVGGVSDLVRPNETGYLAEAENVQDFCQGIVQLLEDEPLRKKMSANCRAIALSEYPLERQATRYIELYQTVLANQ